MNRNSAIFVFAIMCAIAIAGQFVDDKDGGAVRSAKATETYSLVHAIGNTERVSASGLSKFECKKRKEYLALTAAVLSGGSVTCLPDSLL